MRVRLENLSKLFLSKGRKVAAVDRINLEIADKEFFVLLGPSGCGKSTLLNLLAGLEKPSEGRIWFENALVASIEKRIFRSPKERNVALVFQSYALYPHLTVFENIAFPLRMEKEKSARIQGAVKEAAEWLEISELLPDRPAQLSGGQRQRVAIARAIVRRPSLFLLDEPLSNLDAQLRASTRRELKDLQRRIGITTVYVTHDQVEAMTLGDRIAVLKNGRPEQIGAPDELYERPVNSFVGTFIGTPPMNLIQGSCQHDREILVLNVCGQKIAAPVGKIKNLRAMKSGPCFIGIRPEHIRLNPERQRAADISLQGRIDLVEPLGREGMIRMTTAQGIFLVLSSKADLRKGQQVTLGFDFEYLHIFPNLAELEPKRPG